LATWYKKTKEIAIGIGVDDHTALCIDSLGKATVYGTGSVGFYYNMNATEPYDTSASMLRAANMKFTQLIHGCTIDLNSGLTGGLTGRVEPLIKEENGRVNLFFSGTDYPSDDAYAYFVNQAGAKDDAIVIISGNDLARATDAKSKLQSKGAAEVAIIQAISANQSNITVQENINKAQKFFIIANEYNGFMGFINGGENGNLLKEKLEQSGMISFFAGDNARFAGKTVIDKYKGSGYTSYRGTLEFSPGLGLLKTTAVMPNAFVSAETYENTVTGLPYAMLTDSLKYGLYITATTFAGYGITSDSKSYFKNISGNSPLVILQNNATTAGLASQGPYPASRNIAGFGSMNLKFLGVADTVTVGTNIPASVSKPNGLQMKVYPNPARDSFHIQGQGSHYRVQISDLTGKIMLTKKFFNNTDITLVSCPEGIYLVNVYDVHANGQFSTTLTKIK